ncbi:hypothetical protein ACTHGU_15460 [Chitinophagaceae bacterium MMS25-I14]
MGKHYRAFEDYYNERQGYDNGKAEMFVRKICIGPLIIAAFFSFETRLITGTDGFTFRGFTDIHAQQHAYSEVAALTLIENSEDSNGRVIKNGHYTVSFKDGTRIKCGFYFNNIAAEKEFIEKTEQKTGLHVIHILLQRNGSR